MVFFYRGMLSRGQATSYRRLKTGLRCTSPKVQIRLASPDGFVDGEGRYPQKRTLPNHLATNGFASTPPVDSDRPNDGKVPLLSLAVIRA